MYYVLYSVYMQFQKYMHKKLFYIKVAIVWLIVDNVESISAAQGYLARKKFARQIFKCVYLSLHNYKIVYTLSS